MVEGNYRIRVGDPYLENKAGDPPRGGPGDAWKPGVGWRGLKSHPPRLVVTLVLPYQY